MKKIATASVVGIVISTLSMTLDAFSQESAFNSLLQHLGGCIVWGSAGFQHFTDSRRNPGGGFAAIYGPIDLSDPPRIWRNPKDSLDTIVIHKNPVMTLTLGYEFSVHRPEVASSESNVSLGG